MPNASTPISVTTSTRMLSHSPARIDGRDDQAILGLRNVACTRGQPGVLVSPTITTAANTTVDTSATSVERRAPERRGGGRSRAGGGGSGRGPGGARAPPLFLEN